MGPIEEKLRKLRREYVLATGISPMVSDSSTVLVMSGGLWSQYIAENKLEARVAFKRGEITFEGVRLIVDPTLPDDVAYYAEESIDECDQREYRQLHNTNRHPNG